VTVQRPDQVYDPNDAAIPAGAATQTVRAQTVIVSGSNDGVFVYDGSPAAGNLIAAVAAQDGTDPYGNDYFAGIGVYQEPTGSTFSTLLTQGAINFAFADPWYVKEGGIFPGETETASAQPFLGIQSPGDDTATAGTSNIFLNGTSQDGTAISNIYMTRLNNVAGTQGLVQVEIHGSLILDEGGTPPTPSGAGVLWVSAAGHLIYKNPSGGTTTLAN
jgi:hypothetical protein